MRSLDEFFDKFWQDQGLKHALPYDPQKAHEYYLRNRELKGRQAGAVAPKAGSSTSAAPGKKSGAQLAVAQVIGKGKPPMSNQAAQAQVAAIQQRIGALKKVLSSLLVEQKQSDKAAEKKAESKSSGSSGGSSGPKRVLTSRQEADAKKRSKDFYDKNKKPAVKKPVDLSVDEKIQVVRDQIKHLRTVLAVAQGKLTPKAPAKVVVKAAVKPVVKTTAKVVAAAPTKTAVKVVAKTATKAKLPPNMPAPSGPVTRK